MSDSFWDERYGGEDYIFGVQPNAFLVEQAFRLPPGGKVLVPGDGEGRNGVWLAGQGMAVTSLDGSPVGLAKARRLAEQRGVTIATEACDLVTWDWPKAAFDAVVSLFLHLAPADRALVHKTMVAALRPGGIVVLEAFRPEQLAYASGGPKSLSLLYTVQQLEADFAGTEILLLESALTRLDEGERHRGEGATVRLVVRKP